MTIIAISLGTIAIAAVSGALTVQITNPPGVFGSSPFEIGGSVNVDTSVVTVDASGWPVNVNGSVDVSGNLNCN